MLTDTKLRHLKPQDKPYKVTDRDGLYVVVSKVGTISFRYNYQFCGRQETVTFGQFGPAGISLAEARQKLIEAKRIIAQGISSAREKARVKQRIKDAQTFDDWAQAWLNGLEMADSTRDMRRACYQRELASTFGNKHLNEITHEDLRNLTSQIAARGAPATAVHTREVVMQVFRWAIERGQKVDNPADLVRPTSIARFTPRERALSPDEIGLMYAYLDRVAHRARHSVGDCRLPATAGREGLFGRRGGAHSDRYQPASPPGRKGPRRAANSRRHGGLPAGMAGVHVADAGGQAASQRPHA